MPYRSFICEFCVSDRDLRAELQERGKRLRHCPTCKSSNGKGLSVEDDRLRRILRALVRLNYSEWDYNHHIGGDSLQALMARHDTIFNLSKHYSDYIPDEVWVPVEDFGWYPESGEDISLGGGYYDGNVLWGIRDYDSNRVRGLVKRALENNHFEVESDVARLLDSLRGDISRKLTCGSEFYRARVGVQSRLTERASLSPTDNGFLYQPYAEAKIGAPPLHLATEGRFNRARVSILYLASDVLTAVAEIRPHPGHLISTSKFRSTRNLEVADFSNFDIRNFLSDERLETLRDILSIAAVLNVPVQPEHRYLYSVTQLFADAIRMQGYDGILFPSTVSKGENLTCFTPGAFELVDDSADVHEVAAVEYTIKKMPILEKHHVEDDYEKNEETPFATLLYGLARREK
ncbi:TPA: RES family NAD+ phosphorylase [Pseudomonas putida]|nr:RES family NAD+ phosphorylase [Pseudomonas putida]